MTELPQAASAAVPKTRRGSLLDFFKHSAVRYLIVGGLSFLVDFGLLVLLHEVFRWQVGIATAAAFLLSLVFNFAVQRQFSFESSHKTHVSIIRYGLLVAANTVASVLIVQLLTPTILGYMGGKVISTAAMTIWNYFLYRHWVFGHTTAPRVVGEHKHKAP
jgi:putative flippase GtrA